MLPGTKGRRRIYLMRHGHVSYVDKDGKLINPHDVLLTDEGINQVQAARDLLKEVPLDHVICSGMPRTLQTAQIVAEPHGLNVNNNIAFKEISGGFMSDVPVERREAAYVYALETADQPNAQFGSGEYFQDFSDRIVPAFEDMLLEEDWKRMLLVCHDGVNRMILSHIIGAGLSGLGSLEQDMACINVIDVDIVDGKVIRRLVKALNITPYNTTKSGMYQTSFEKVFTGIIDF